MPLDEKAQPCAEVDCKAQTNYYKLYSIPYVEGLMLGANRKVERKTGRIYLCPAHYEMPAGKYEIMAPGSFVAGDFWGES